MIWSPTVKKTGRFLGAQVFSLSYGSLFIVHRVGSAGVCWILRKARVPWVPAWPRQSVGHRACASSIPPLWERQGDRDVGRFENWFKVPLPVSGGTRITTEICFTCLQVCLLDFHIGRTGWWPSPLHWVNFPPNSSFFQNFCQLPEAATGCLRNASFLISTYFYKWKCFPTTVLEVPWWIPREIWIYIYAECLTSEKWVNCVTLMFLSSIWSFCGSNSTIWE